MSDDKVVDIAKIRATREQPDAAHVYIEFRDGVAVKWFRFAASFTDDDGGVFRFELWARDNADAERRIARIRETAKLDGQVYAVIDA